LQLDNSAKDNKKKLVVNFYPLSILKRIFKKITMRFIIVGFTHKDNDDHLNRLSKLLKLKNTYVLEDLIKEFMDLQKTTTFSLKCIYEVAAFKLFVKNFHKECGISFLDYEIYIYLSSTLRKMEKSKDGLSCNIMCLFQLCCNTPCSQPRFTV
jgi:hypothetical protein